MKSPAKNPIKKDSKRNLSRRKGNFSSEHALKLCLGHLAYDARKIGYNSVADAIEFAARLITVEQRGR